MSVGRPLIFYFSLKGHIWRIEFMELGFEEKLDFEKCKYNFCFESLKVKIGVRTNDLNFLKKIKKSISTILPIEWSEISLEDVTYWFSIVKSKKGFNKYSAHKDAEFLRADDSSEEILNTLESQIRATVAEFAEDFVFLHAGVVSWNEKAIIIPGKSFSGKTTLVKELIKRNCDYLSDEFAVIDKEGLVYPFPKKLSVRGIIDDFKQVDFAVEELGGIQRLTPVPVGYLLVTEFKSENKKPKFKISSVGEGVMASMANSLSVRQNPKFVLEVLSIVAKRVTVLQTERGEVSQFVDEFLDYLENLENSKGKLIAI